MKQETCNHIWNYVYGADNKPVHGATCYTCKKVYFIKRKIAVKVYEEVKYPLPMSQNKVSKLIEWVDNKGINTPYVITMV